MADEKQKMTSSYKAVFVFSIVMSVLMFVLYSAEYQTTHKASSTAIPFLLWCYQAWLIYKQQNAKLVGFYKAMLWIGGIALALLSLMLIGNVDVYGVNVLKLIGIAVMLGIYYGMLQYFKQQLVNPSITSTTSNNANASNEDYLRAEAEFNSAQRDAGLWVRCFAEADGNEAIAKARYIKSRASVSVFDLRKAQILNEQKLFKKYKNKEKLKFAGLLIFTVLIVATALITATPVWEENKKTLIGLLGGSKHELKINEMIVTSTENPTIFNYSLDGPDNKTYSIDGPVGASRREVIDVMISKDEDKAKWKDFK